MVEESPFDIPWAHCQLGAQQGRRDFDMIREQHGTFSLSESLPAIVLTPVLVWLLEGLAIAPNLFLNCAISREESPRSSSGTRYH